MPTQRKVELVEQITDILTKNNYVIATDYRGLTVAELQELRKKLRDINTEYHIVKNNLTRFAAEKSGNEPLIELLVGPTAIAFGREDATKIAKTLVDYAKATKTTLSIKGGLIDGKLLNAQETIRLATLPPIEILRAQLLGTLQSPIFILQSMLAANIHGLYGVLNARIQQLGGNADVE